MGGLLMMFVAWLLARRHDYPIEETFQLRRLWTTFRDAGWALLLPFIILGGIFTGWVTATEGAGLAVVAAIFVGGSDLQRAGLEDPHRAPCWTAPNRRLSSCFSSPPPPCLVTI